MANSANNFGRLTMTMQEKIKPETCQKRELGDGWWRCDFCGSLWTPTMMGAWWAPLSCPDRQKSNAELTGSSK
jgi:hypothetical protein